MMRRSMALIFYALVIFVVFFLFLDPYLWAQWEIWPLILVGTHLYPQVTKEFDILIGCIILIKVIMAVTINERKS